MADVDYRLGPWIWGGLPAGWSAPAGCIGRIDFGTAAEAGAIGSQRRVGLFCFPRGTPVPSEYDLLDSGDGREIALTSRHQGLVQAVVGVRPEGATLAQGLYSVLLNGDPLGLDRWLPLQPTHDGTLEVRLGGHSVIHSERFVWGQHAHTNRLRDLLRDQFRQIRKEYQAEEKRLRKVAQDLRKAGQLAASARAEAVADGLKDDRQAGKYLGGLARQYGCDSREITTDVAPSRPATTHTENFTRADGTTIGNLLTWTELDANWSTVSNQLSLDTGYAVHKCRADADVSSSDHYAQITVTGAGSTTSLHAAACARFSALAATFYSASAFNADTAYLYKFVAGTPTVLGSTAYAWTTPETVRTKCDGSTISAWFEGVSKVSVTDTSISSGTRGGVWGYLTSLPEYFDDYEISDLSAPTNRRRRLLFVCGA